MITAKSWTIRSPKGEDDEEEEEVEPNATENN
jgi:hypothetical protein